MYGQSLGETFEVMGVHTTPIRPPGRDGHTAYFVWRLPACWAGCCDGAVAIELYQGQLTRVVVHNVFDREHPAHSDDVARYEPGGPRPSGVRFSPERTLDAVLKSEWPGFDALKPAGEAGSPQP